LGTETLPAPATTNRAATSRSPSVVPSRTRQTAPASSQVKPAITRSSESVGAAPRTEVAFTAEVLKTSIPRLKQLHRLIMPRKFFIHWLL
jgi:hypothetical protein